TRGIHATPTPQGPPRMNEPVLTPTFVRLPPAPSAAPPNLAEYEALAPTRLPAAASAYYAARADDGITLRANRWVYERLGLRPRVLVDVSRVDTSIELLGTRLALPVLLAPTAFLRLAREEGDLAAARAARAAGTLLVTSTLATHP